ncbi:hypothetical protein COV04_01210 [Candidatus Uhrbacteria bacterium CG10_big_fil_rev_8_21_14_0_10_48_11]|uniref:Glycosyltransferase family 4 protein n=1 Tax=Candidatus Uhrbacteria bacterium CG10_big_fil_rev_8_21_14_0_10_48_11 TaxID=1975037 RepID=A0A2M8LFA5_9BACT|nr:MAG: hypothetical protein COV04_01210 [Candidatus Uhrbacteria bacterium CG10_big_fil_rev_8_21_14_0_10_48_11]
MRIALFTDTFLPQTNGVATVVAASAAGLAAQGHQVCVVTNSSAKQHAHSTVTKEGYQLITVPSVRFPLYPGERLAIPLGRTVYQMKRFHPQLIHAHTPFSVGMEGLYLSRVFKIPLVGTHHTFHDHYLKHVKLDFSFGRWISWKYIVGFYNRCRYVLSPSKALADALELHGLVRPITVLSNTIDASCFMPATTKTRQAFRAVLGVAGIVFVYVGRLSYEKNVTDVITAFAIAVIKLPTAILLIVGDGPERADLEALSKKLAVDDRVLFLGIRRGDALRQVLQAADVFVTASQSENMPMTVLEAMASGLPVIGVQALGVPELIKEGENGFLVPPGDHQRFADAFIILAKDSALRHSFGEASRQRVVSQYDPGKLLTRLEHLYQQVVND